MTCRRVKAWLSQREIPFTERNVEEDADAAEELKSLGFTQAPTTFIDGTPIRGFDQEQQEQFVKLLGLDTEA